MRVTEGVIAIGGPIGLDQAFIIGAQPRRLLIGADPLAHELLWDRLYLSVSGRGGERPGKLRLRSWPGWAPG
jgi:hypothetical protein